MKVWNWAMFKLYKGYLIPSSFGVTKKLTQQYVGSFQIVERVGQLAYKFGMPEDWKIHPVFSVAQLEPPPDPSEDLFRRFCPQLPPLVFVDDDTDKHKFFEIACFLNKCIVRRSRGLAVEYLVRWTGYGPE